MTAPIVIGGALIAATASFMGGSAGINLFLTSSREQAKTEFDTRFSDITDPNIRVHYLDAFTHMYTSGRVVQASGSEIFAKLLGDLNELRGGNSDSLKNMDFWNNGLGRTLGGSTETIEELATEVENAIRNGSAITDPVNDSRKFDDGIIKVESKGLDELNDINFEDISGFEPENNDNNAPTPVNSWFNNLTDELLNFTFTDLPFWRETVDLIFNNIPTLRDPLVIDLDNDGITTDFIGAETQYFDLDSNGFAEATEWIGGDDGFLARDLNGNGIIDNGGELFGNDTIDGFSMLAGFDDNADGQITAADAIWSDLVIWQDLNGDAQTQADELSTLDVLGITGIDVVNVQEITEGREALSHTGLVQTTTGTLEAGNFNFSRNTVNTRFVGDYDFDIRAAFLPTLRGYGQMADLHIAMSLDNDETDPGSLISLMTNIASHSFTGLFENYDSVQSDLVSLLYRWAGVEDVATDARGTFLADARVLEFIESYFRSVFIDANIPNANPGQVQAQAIEDLWDFTLLPRLTGAILFQAQGSTMFESGLAYEFSGEDAVRGTAHLSQDALDDLVVAATALSDTAARIDFWTGVADFLRGVGIASGRPFALLDQGDIDALTLAIETSDSALTWLQENHDPDNGLTSIEYRYNNPDGETIIGDETDNTDLTGTGAADTIIGLAGADVIDGGLGNDTLYGHNEDGSGDDNANDNIRGNDGDDVLVGGGGDDTLNGGVGGDHLIGGDGNDTLIDGNVLVSTVAQNLLQGGAGDDHYRIGAGTNVRDEIFVEDSSGFDDLIFNGITTTAHEFSNMRFTRFLNNDLKIDVAGIDLYLVDQLLDLNNANGLGIERMQVRINGTLTNLDLKDYLLTTTDQIETLGTGFDDVINGINIGNPDDNINAFGGNDIVNGDAGNDVILGGGGNDILFGGVGEDRLFGENGNDTLNGGGDDDDLFGADGDDILNGDGGDDLLLGDAGNDTLNGGDGNDVLRGFTGDDVYILSAGNDTYRENGGTNDVIVMSGVRPEDLAFSNTSTSDVTISASGNVTGSITVQSQADNGAPDQKIEFLKFDDGFELLFGNFNNWGRDSQTDSTSDETLSGFTTIFTNGGTDRIFGASSVRNWLSAGADDDFLHGTSGDDFLHGGTGDDYLEARGGDNQIWGAEGIDTISYSGSSASVTLDLVAGTATGEGNDSLISIENVIGSAQADSLLGDAGVNIISAGNGDDFVQGRDGDDVIDGEAGNDKLFGNYGNDILNGGSGDDELNGGFEDDQLFGSNGEDTLYGGDGDDQLFGELGTDRLYGENGNDILNGGAERDSLFGGDGNDTLFGEDGLDNLFGDAGDDILDGGNGLDILEGGAGNDTLLGGEGSDKLFGDDGDDILNGGIGYNRLTGGAGNDTFLFEGETAFTGGTDQILDWETGDKLDISDILSDFGFDAVNDALEDWVNIANQGDDSFLQIDRDGIGATEGFDNVAKIYDQSLTLEGLLQDSALITETV